MIKKIALLSFFSLILFTGKVNAQAFNYKECMTRAENIGDSEIIRCNKTQTLVDAQVMQDMFDQIAADKEFTTLSKEDLKRTYNAFMVYRNNYCKMYANAYKTDMSEEFGEAKCLQEITRNTYLYIFSVTNAMYADRE